MIPEPQFFYDTSRVWAFLTITIFTIPQGVQVFLWYFCVILWHNRFSLKTFLWYLSFSWFFYDTRFLWYLFLPRTFFLPRCFCTKIRGGSEGLLGGSKGGGFSNFNRRTRYLRWPKVRSRSRFRLGLRYTISYLDILLNNFPMGL